MAYFFLDRFGMPPDVTARQDEAIMSDIAQFDQQVGYRRWAKAHPDDVMDDDDEDDDEIANESFSEEIMDWKAVFGATSG